MKAKNENSKSRHTIHIDFTARLWYHYLANKYNTFLVHDEEYFDRILKELSIENGYLVYHRDGEEIVAYSLVDSSHNVIESVFKNIPSGLKIKDKKPYVMVKVLDDKTDVGKFFVNDET